MMDDAYFVGRKQILDWLNDLLQLKLTKIEETASGAVACQVMDALFPGKVPMSKVNWGAKTDYEFVANYKVLQSVFAKLSISRAIEVDRLIRARYQDNLEFMQWLKKFFEDNYSNCVEVYEPLAQRAKGKNVNMYIPAQGGAPVKKRVSSREVKQQFHKSAPKKSATPTKENKLTANTVPVNRTIARKGSNAGPGASNAVAELEEEVKTLKAQNAALATQNEGFERERDFYFDKLREVEVMLQQCPKENDSVRNVARQVLRVLYATEDDVDGEAALAAAEAALAESENEVCPEEEAKLAGGLEPEESKALDNMDAEGANMDHDDGISNEGLSPASPKKEDE